MDVMSRISLHGYHVTDTMSRISCHGCLVMDIMPWISCHGCHVMEIIYELGDSVILFDDDVETRQMDGWMDG